MRIESFLDSTVELYQAEASTLSGSSTLAQSWGFRVLTLQPGKSPALYESPELYSSLDLALKNAKLHALKAKVENTESVPCCATWWDTDLVYVQNDLSITAFGNACNRPAGNYYTGGARSRLRQELKNSENGHHRSHVTFSHSGQTWEKEIDLTLVSVGDWLFILENYTEAETPTALNRSPSTIDTLDKDSEFVS